MRLSSRLLGENDEIVRDTNLQILLLAGITAPLGVSLISPLFDTLTGPFGVSPTSIGLLVTAYTAPALVFVPLSGALADRYGRKPVLVAGLVLFGIGGSAISLTTDFTAILALRVLQGIGFAGITPIVITSIGDVYSDAAGATGQGLRTAAVGGAQTVFPLIAGVLVVVAWQLPFLLYAMALPIAVVVAVWFEEPTTNEESTEAAETRGATGGRSYARRMGRLLSRPSIVALLVAYSGPTFLYFGFHAYVSIVVLQVYDGTPRQAGLVVALFSIVYAIAGTQSGRLTDRYGGQLPSLIGTNAVMGAGLITVALAPSLLLGLIGTIGFGIGFGLTSSLYRSVLPDHAPDRLRGGLVSAGEGLGRLAAAIAPIAIGALIAALEPLVGFVDAIRWSIVAVGAGTALVGILSVAVALSWIQTTDE